MALTTDESAELLEFLRTRVSASVYQRLDDAAISQARSVEDPAARLQTYLESLVSMIAAESGVLARNAEERLQKYLDVPFQGFEIELPPYERDLLGRSTIPLREISDSSPLVSRLRALLNEIKRSDEPPFPPRTRGFSG